MNQHVSLTKQPHTISIYFDEQLVLQCTAIGETIPTMAHSVHSAPTLIEMLWDDELVYAVFQGQVEVDRLKCITTNSQLLDLPSPWL